MNNFELMKSVQENTQIEEVLFQDSNITMYIKGENETLTFCKYEYYAFLVMDEWVKNYGPNYDSQLAECQSFDHSFNNWDACFHYMIKEREYLEVKQRAKTATLPDLSFATTQLKNLL